MNGKLNSLIKICSNPKNSKQKKEHKVDIRHMDINDTNKAENFSQTKRLGLWL